MLTAVQVLMVQVLLAVQVHAQPFVWPSEWTSNANEAQYGGVVRVRGTPPRTFNAFVSSEGNTVFDLTRRGATLLKQAPSGEWLPYAAESFTVSQEGTVIDMVLREGIKWSDGVPVTINDYLFTYRAFTDPGVDYPFYEYFFIGGEKILLEATAERGLRWTLPTAERTAFDVISFSPQPNHILGETYRRGGAEALKAAWGTATDPRDTVWTSAFVPVALSPERMVFERNPYFSEWNVDRNGHPLPYLDGITAVMTTTQEAAVNLFLAGEIDVIRVRPIDQLAPVLAAVEIGTLDATVALNASPIAGSQFIVFNWNLASDPFKQALFRSADFRRAMSHLVDRDAIVELVYGGAAEPMWSGVYRVHEQWLNPAVQRYPYDPERSLSLLNGLGFTETNSQGMLIDEQGHELAFTLTTNGNNQQLAQIAALFADSAADVGVRVQVRLLDFNLLVDLLAVEGNDRPFEAMLLGLGGPERSWPFDGSVIMCSGGLHMYNRSGECLSSQESEMERVYVEGRSTLDDESARALGYRLQEIEVSFLPFIYTVSPTEHFTWRNHVGGMHPPELLDSLLGDSEPELLYLRR